MALAFASGGAGGAGGTTDGWTADSNPWVFVSASSFKIAGVDLSAVLTPGTKLRWTQTTVRYGIVASVAFSVDTTVTIIGNTDYTIANAAISANSFSYDANPVGFPAGFNYTAALTGFSADPGTVFARFSVTGRIVYIAVATNNGTSNATTLTVAIPVACASTGGTPFFAGQVRDSGAVATTPGRVFVNAAGDTVVRVNKDYAGTAFTASGSKACNFTMFYEM